MPMYHGEPNRSEPASHMWFSVETPNVFKEYKLPASNTDWTKADWRKFNELKAMAENHGTHVHCTAYRKG